MTPLLRSAGRWSVNLNRPVRFPGTGDPPADGDTSGPAFEIEKKEDPFPETGACSPAPSFPMICWKSKSAGRTGSDCSWTGTEFFSGTPPERTPRPHLAGGLPVFAHHGTVRRGPGGVLLRGHSRTAVHLPPRFSPPASDPAGGAGLLAQCRRPGFPLRSSAGVSQRNIAPPIVEHPPGLPWNQTDDGVQTLREGTDFPGFARGP